MKQEVIRPKENAVQYPRANDMWRIDGTVGFISSFSKGHVTMRRLGQPSLAQKFSRRGFELLTANAEAQFLGPKEA